MNPRLVSQAGSEPVSPFAQVAVGIPEAPERSAQSQRNFAVAPVERPLQRRPQVIVFTFQAVQPYRLVAPNQLRLGCLGKLQEVTGMAPPDRRGDCAPLEPLQHIF